MKVQLQRGIPLGFIPVFIYEYPLRQLRLRFENDFRSLTIAETPRTTRGGHRRRQRLLPIGKQVANSNLRDKS